jgi:hypothetical protein
MSLDREQVVRGNLIPEGLVAPHSASWPPDAVDGQLHWHLPEQKMYVYDAAGDYWVPVSAQQQQHFEPVIQDFVNINTLLLTDVRDPGSPWYFFNRMANKNLIVPQGISTAYEALWRYLYWQLAADDGSVNWTTPTQFDTEDAFFDFLESVVPHGGGHYGGGVHFRVFELVDDTDTYPNLVRHRNSLLAAMKGSRNWIRGRQFGLDNKFTSGVYYLNYYDELGQRFVIKTTGHDPDVGGHGNNDDILWYHRGGRGTLWRWPLVNADTTVPPDVNKGSIYVPPGYKPTVWDDNPGVRNYVAAPAGYYITKAPFCLVEHNTHMLSIEDLGNVQHRNSELWFPMVMVFPVVMYDGVNPRWYAFLVVPHGSNSFSTDNVDAGNYDFMVCCKYRHTYRKMYVGPVAPEAFSTIEHSMFNLNHLPFNPRDANGNQSVDKDSIPIQIDTARRNRSTGARSRWFPTYKVNRRINHAAFRVDPAPWKK